MDEYTWETIVDTDCTTTERLKVSGGYLYHRCDYFMSDCDHKDNETTTMCFVPDVDLQRYQSHLRDAYNQGFKDGKEERKNCEITSENQIPL